MAKGSRGAGGCRRISPFHIGTSLTLSTRVSICRAVPPRDKGLHDPGRRPYRDRQGRRVNLRLQVRGRDQARPEAHGRRHPEHGQLGPKHQRQPGEEQGTAVLAALGASLLHSPQGILAIATDRPLPSPSRGAVFPHACSDSLARRKAHHLWQGAAAWQ